MTLLFPTFYLKQSAKRNGQAGSRPNDSYRNFKLRHFATRFITSINYFERKGWQGEFQTSGFPYVRRKVRRVQLSRISRFHPLPFVTLFSFFNLFRFTCSPCLFVLLSLIFCHSLVTDQRSPAHPSGPNNLYRFFHYARTRTLVFPPSSLVSFLLLYFRAFLCRGTVNWTKTHGAIIFEIPWQNLHANLHIRIYLIDRRRCGILTDMCTTSSTLYAQQRLTGFLFFESLPFSHE